MSVWACFKCKKLYGNLYVCPDCGGRTELANFGNQTVTTEAPVINQSVPLAAQASPAPEREAPKRRRYSRELELRIRLMAENFVGKPSPVEGEREMWEGEVERAVALMDMAIIAANCVPAACSGRGEGEETPTDRFIAALNDPCYSEESTKLAKEIAHAAMPAEKSQSIKPASVGLGAKVGELQRWNGASDSFEVDKDGPFVRIDDVRALLDEARK